MSKAEQYISVAIVDDFGFKVILQAENGKVALDKMANINPTI